MPTPKASIKKKFASGNGRVRDAGNVRREKTDLIFVLKTGSSSLKFGIYRHGSERRKKRC